MVRALMRGVYKAATDIMLESQRIVPVDTSTLKQSARVGEPEVFGAHVQVELGYGYGAQVNPKTGQVAGQYAVPVHERLDQYHAPPTQAKFLERAMLDYADRYGPTLAAYITRVVKERETGLRFFEEAL